MRCAARLRNLRKIYSIFEQNSAIIQRLEELEDGSFEDVTHSSIQKSSKSLFNLLLKFIDNSEIGGIRRPRHQRSDAQLNREIFEKSSRSSKNLLNLLIEFSDNLDIRGIRRQLRNFNDPTHSSIEKSSKNLLHLLIKLNDNLKVVGIIRLNWETSTTQLNREIAGITKETSELIARKNERCVPLDLRQLPRNLPNCLL